ncbi:MAG TPA: glycosyltransferase [Nitrospirota bacterium]|nr:glycosyltransferase [Nitrospirota bacterium]
MDHMDRMAVERDKYLKRNYYYYEDLIKMLRYNIPEGASVLEIGCGTGFVLNSLKPLRGVGIDISGEMIKKAKERYPHLEFQQMDSEDITLGETFDYILITDTLIYLEDIQKAFKEMKKVSHPDTRILITLHNFLWSPILGLAEFLKLKMPQKRLNWLSVEDIAGLLYVENYDVIKQGRRFLVPRYLPGISWLFNKFVSQLPPFNLFCLTEYIIARPLDATAIAGQKSVSVVIPARNEKGNIRNAVTRMPQMGEHTEIIFVEGHSGDGTLDEIRNVCEEYRDDWDIKYTVQDGTGKGDAVRKGFAMAKGDILMILDADLTVPPEELPKFYDAIAFGKGEFINGSRLIYPLEKEAMRLLNMAGNKFFSFMFSWILGQRLKDTLCGTKVLSKKNYERLISNRNYFGEFDPFGDFDLIFGASKLNLKIVEIPIRYQARTYGETNISRFRHGWLLLKMTLFGMNKIKFN